MHEFSTALRHLDHQTLQYHLERGDFSRWLYNTIADMDLAARAAVWEDELQAAALSLVTTVLMAAGYQRFLPRAVGMPSAVKSSAIAETCEPWHAR